ncbi:hypothetical protein BTW00_02120 [Psychrobacter sp. C 20.9]|uniref:hypothetical protein n=1 Tax=Psychrobacter sp. C 20.9 TaxID=1926477 RepID=UPI000946F3BD|nr:hypothetical protein [Psychrobacter sp. C 20.9]OLF37979.1 hypothetical protein BTW00_02120 [Psychrobacter sp. C 20.9]
MSEEDIRVLNAYRATSIYTVNAVKAAIEDMGQSLASSVYDADTKGVIRDRIVELEHYLDVIESDPE